MDGSGRGIALQRAPVHVNRKSSPCDVNRPDAGGFRPRRERATMAPPPAPHAVLPAPDPTRDDPRPLPPEPPLPSDCCDSGCDPCVHDTHAEAMQDYRERLARWRERHPDAD